MQQEQVRPEPFQLVVLQSAVLQSAVLQSAVLQSVVLQSVVCRLVVLQKVVPEPVESQLGVLPVVPEPVALERLVVSPRRHSGVLVPQAELLQAHLHHLNLW
jgi:hypothetical protein